MPNTDSALIVFARAPQPGAAKTRLIPRLGDAGAANLQARLVEHTLAMASRSALVPLELHGTPGDDRFLRESAACYGATFVSQCDGDLGQRMHAAMTGALARSARVILIGSDCPALGAAHVRSAALALAQGHDAVFAPTEDGGYALIGLTRCDPQLFERMPWSHADLMNETRARLRGLGWRWHEIETLWDVDHPADYERLLASGLLACDP